MEGRFDNDDGSSVGVWTPMGFKERVAGVLIAVVALLAVAPGCGGSTEASAEFLGPKGKNSTAEFGEEASDAEREAASQVLEENLKARAAGAWALQCASLSERAITEFEKEASVFGEQGCKKSVEVLARAPHANKTKAIRANTLTGPIDALRVKGDEGYALYHGTKGKDYAMKMEKEDGKWKVGSLITTTLP
jgi:hypothetical protein